MKHLILNLKPALTLILLILLGYNIKAQNSEQTKMFFNRNQVALMKVEKEMYYANNTTYSAELKKAMKYQAIALNLHNQGNFKDAVGYAYKSRNLCIEICTQMNIAERTFYALNDDEKIYCHPASYNNLVINMGLLQPAQITEIDNLNLMDPANFYNVIMNISK